MPGGSPRRQAGSRASNGVRMTPGDSPSRRPQLQPPEEFVAPPPVSEPAPERGRSRVMIMRAAGAALLIAAGVLGGLESGATSRPSARRASPPAALVTP